VQKIVILSEGKEENQALASCLKALFPECQIEFQGNGNSRQKTWCLDETAPTDEEH
jgi:hypothetical protein